MDTIILALGLISFLGLIVSWLVLPHPGMLPASVEHADRHLNSALIDSAA